MGAEWHWLGGGILGLYVLPLLWLWRRQGRLIFRPKRVVEDGPARWGIPFETVHFVNSSGNRLHGWYLPAPCERVAPARGVALFFHGNGGNVGNNGPIARALLASGLSVLLFDYRGYGESQGVPDESGFYSDSWAAWRYLIDQRGVAPERILLVGHSIGAAVAAWLGARQNPGGVLLLGAMTSVAQLAAERYPLFPARYLVRARFDCQDALRDVRAPLLLVHGREDRDVPVSHCERLAAVASPPNSPLLVPGDHESAFFPDNAAFADGLKAFVEQAFPLHDRLLRKIFAGRKDFHKDSEGGVGVSPA